MKHFGAVVGFAFAFDEARSRWETHGEQSHCRGRTDETRVSVARPPARGIARRNASVSPAPQRDHLTLQTLKANERIVPTEPSAMSSISGRPPLPVTELSAYSVPFGAVK